MRVPHRDATTRQTRAATRPKDRRHADVMSAPRSRLICYSLTLPPDVDRPDLIWQLEASLESLRRVAPSQHARIFFYGSPPAAIENLARHANADLVRCPPYVDRLRSLVPAAAPVLAAYPLLHKYLNFNAMADLAPEQVLLADCDTLFFDDPARLFDRYLHADVVAREEPTTARSVVGHDPTYVDEPALQALGASLGLTTPPPFNIGVLLLNHAHWRTLAQLERQFVLYALRFLVWMADNPATGAAATFGESAAATMLRTSHAALLTPRIRAAALPYPSSNRWILDQVALWFTIAHIPGCRYADFDVADVAQNGEIFAHRPRDAPWVVAHYFSQNLPAVDQWLRSDP